MNTVFNACILQYGFRLVLDSLIDCLYSRMWKESEGSNYTKHRYYKYIKRLKALLAEVIEEDNR